LKAAHTNRQDGALPNGSKFFLLHQENKLNLTEVKQSAVGVITMIQIIRPRRIR
jgi:hypothetical protein